MIGANLLNSSEEQYLIVLHRKDIGPILVDLLSLNINKLSPFTEVLKNYAQGAVPLSTDGEELSKDKVFASIASALAAPDFMIRNRLGGSMIPFDEVRICGGRLLGEALVMVTIGEDDSYNLMVFKDYKSFITWWVDSFAGKNKESIANFIPPTVSLESFLFILHAVDWFKRESYKNALDYAAGQQIHINPQEFSQGMEKSLKSKDMRWLLPSFVMLVPGLEKYNLNIVPENAQILNHMQFFNNTKHPQSQEKVYVFGEAGHSMGVEFMRSWLMSAGFEFSTIRSGSISTTNQLFIAPTALANHFVQLEPSNNNNCMINHQAYTFEQLQGKMETLFKAFIESAFQQVLSRKLEQEAQQSTEASSIVTKEIPVTAASGHCSNCGAQLGRNTKFCIECGTPTPAASPQPAKSFQAAYCSGCQREISQGSKFCISCGKPVGSPANH